ncbi:MaoC family dehydratase [Derxia gummosa]|uniref:MaoC family dehydratase n=1 Tax=Derxia gummosa DSM 723 TaxID=1121388 RepID=A0A8B6X458_9BURK|nr:MaoC family dehydratase [Derxia gummosa]
MKFADLHAGQVIEHGPASLTEAEMLAFARQYDPQWFHVDAERARTGRWGGLIASGWQTCGLAMRMATEAVLHDSESFGSPGLAWLRWPSPVRAGDRLSFRADVIDARVSASKPHIGIVRWRWRLLADDGREVLDLEATSFFDLAVAPTAAVRA